MTTTTIRGIPVNFPFPPYDIQVNYMEKVIQCLQEGKNGVLESPTGTGKTLSLLCASLAWLEVKKAQVQAHTSDMFENNHLESVAGAQNARNFLTMSSPTIIYASRTHSQLSQAMQALKKTSYNHLKATVLGSRELMCIHQQVINEPNKATQIHMCRSKVKQRTCQYYNKVESSKEDSAIRDLNVIDIEDIVKLGRKHKFCPYFMSKELQQKSDIVFTPYNYLLDPKSRRSLGLSLKNNVIIFDEGHNIEEICENSASMQIKSTDITLCIEEVTAVMKQYDNATLDIGDQETPKDFKADDLCILKVMFLEFEKVLDKIKVIKEAPGTYFAGNYIYEIFKDAGLDDDKYVAIHTSIDRIIQYLTTITDGPLARRGAGLQLFSDFLMLVYAERTPEYREKIRKCYKVHVAVEVPKKGGDDWLSKAKTKTECRVLSFWCFNPGFGMNMLREHGVHSIILTSGTLAPLKPLISELELNVEVQIENPHIVKEDQVYVTILKKGPDQEELNSKYDNRDNPKYITSLGTVLQNLTSRIPNGVLIFFPSYPIMLNCERAWRKSGVWNSINETKQIFVEPRDKSSFNFAMDEYYSKINDPNLNGAIFMGVCRGKVSEGLDFADINGRAVFIIGLPYPPTRSPKVMLKRSYLDMCNAKNKEYLTGKEWYDLEATRAVNQAIGRVIRHKNDYGAIILLDIRFDNPRQILNNMSFWLRKYIKVNSFPQIVRDLRMFFKNAEAKLPMPKPKNEMESSQVQPKQGFFDFSSCSASSSSDTSALVTIHKRKPNVLENSNKKIKITVVPNATTPTPLHTAVEQFIATVKKNLSPDCFKKFINAMAVYRTNEDFDELRKSLDQIFASIPNLRYIIKGLDPYVKARDKPEFLKYCDSW